jgi:hypothetical protein
MPSSAPLMLASMVPTAGPENLLGSRRIGLRPGLFAAGGSQRDRVVAVDEPDAIHGAALARPGHRPAEKAFWR